jgi:hypothetical protein
LPPDPGGPEIKLPCILARWPPSNKAKSDSVLVSAAIKRPPTPQPHRISSADKSRSDPCQVYPRPCSSIVASKIVAVRLVVGKDVCRPDVICKVPAHLVQNDPGRLRHIAADLLSEYKDYNLPHSLDICNCFCPISLTSKLDPTLPIQPDEELVHVYTVHA